MKARAILLILLVAGVATGGWWWWRAGAQRAVVIAGLPAVPDLSAGSPILLSEVAAANARARSRLTAQRGLIALSRLYHGNGYFAEALTCYGLLSRLDPTEPRWLHLRASILAGYGELEPAITLWQSVTQLAPNYVAAHLRLGEALLKSNQAAAAAAEYERVLQLRPDDAYALLGLARIDLEAQQWTRAKERLETVVRQTNFNLGYDLIVTLYERLGLKKEAAAIRGAAKASGAYRDFPDPWLNDLMDECYDPYRLGLAAGVAAQSGDSAAALRLLQRATELAPDDVSSHFQLGGFAEAQKDLKLAREEFELCTRLAPTFPDGWARLSDLQARSGEPAAAERTLTEGLARCPDSPGLHLMRARKLRDARQMGAAISAYQTSIRFRPNEPEGYVELGNLLIELGQEDEGIRQMRLAVEADPGDPTALGMLAFRAISTSQEAEARRWLNRIALQPRVPPEQSSVLFQAYQQTFGRAFRPDLPAN
jgi:tetratricopeptide (TPR) repeat protein